MDLPKADSDSVSAGIFEDESIFENFIISNETRGERMRPTSQEPRRSLLSQI
jgi:hypothetical protein